MSGVLTVEELTFNMKAADDTITESYLLAAAITHDGKLLDAETVNEILSLAGTRQEALQANIDVSGLAPDLNAQQATLGQEVKTRNARYYDQLEEIYYRNIEDRRAESDAIIRDYQKKSHEARKNARQADNPTEQLRLKREARTWQRKADDEADRARQGRRELQDKQDDYIELISQALRGTHQREPLFALSWEVIQ
jgi:hypothetical protein